MYHEFFGLKEPAFSIAVNPRYLYMSQQHREALAHLLYGVQNGGFVMLTGEVGTGKTTIIRCLLEQLPDNTDMAIVLNPMASAPELLSTICDELGVSYINDELNLKDLTDALNSFLLANHRKGRKTVLLIDEAQLLKVSVLEQVRLLTNLETTTEKLLQIILVGQPELKKLLARPALRQLSQRITARFHLEALTLAEAQAYIAHRLSVAGMNPSLTPFTPAMIQKIHNFSGGIPRLINVLCERLLLGAYAKNLHQIDNDVFKLAVYEVSGANYQQPEKHSIAASFSRYHAAFIGVVIVAMLLVWHWVPDRPATAINQVAEVASSAAANAQSSSQGELTPAAKVIAEGQLPERQTLSNNDALFQKGWRNLAQAQVALLQYSGAGDAEIASPCGLSSAPQLVCEKRNLNSWDELKEVNRPALLTLVTPDKKWVYVLMIALGEDSLLVRYQDMDIKLSWAEVAQVWNGDMLFVWSRPEVFDKAVGQGDKGPLVTWIAEQFAILDKQPAPLTRQYYTDKLKKRVELFQSSQKMVPDGIFGEQTLRRLNEALGRDKLLIALQPDPVLPDTDATLEATSLVNDASSLERGAN